ncbi:MAG: hypothetical protein NVS1B14_02620 [Vulcanimicrobiaceae bacterium]
MKTLCCALAFLFLGATPAHRPGELSQTQKAALLQILNRALPEAPTDFTAIRGTKIDSSLYDAAISFNSDVFDYCRIYDFTDFLGYWTFECRMHGSGPPNMRARVAAMAAAIQSAIPAGFTQEPVGTQRESRKITWGNAEGIKIVLAAYHYGKQYDLEIEHHIR